MTYDGTGEHATTRGRMSFSRIRRPDWTDLAVVFGPNSRYVEEDYTDLMQHRPEVLLGYRVLLATQATNIRGMRVQKLVILDAMYGMWDRLWLSDAMACMNFGTRAKVEWWEVHRSREGIHINPRTTRLVA